ncbi:hypothetical protein MKW98_010873, partial [Papaver atlanticum]
MFLGVFGWDFLQNFVYRVYQKNDTLFTLEDEDGEGYTANYFPRKWGLSGGWRAFAIVHKLAEGDALVFHLVKVSKFK